jgi:hypothetical protein
MAVFVGRDETALAVPAVTSGMAFLRGGVEGF